MVKKQKKLAELISALPDARLRGDGTLPITSVTADSRQAGPGALFVAVHGTGGDGHGYLAQAVAAGCRAVVHQKALADYLDDEGLGALAASVQVGRTRPAPALLARELNDRPDTRLTCAGVTGTNGKTTVSFLLREMLNRLDGPCGLLGTIRYDDGQQSEPAPLTTPGGPVFYHWLGRMVDHGCRSAAMEISSHALDQGRTAGLQLGVAILTNLGRDHLDYHADMADYLRAKARILDLLRPGAAVVLNRADSHLATLDLKGRPCVGFDARPGAAPRQERDVALRRAHLGLDGTRLELTHAGRELTLESPLVGTFNVENLLAAFAAGVALGHGPEQVARALAGVRQVPGRMERFLLPSGGMAVVDYAHTHDALEAVLGACDTLSDGRLLVVFGCGGDRDRGKRPLMAQATARHADGVWITSDNPRSEDPGTICEDIAAAYRKVTDARADRMEMIVDRTAAIEDALAAAGAGDIVVVAGKGHEDYQLVGDRVLHLDDREIIRHWIRRQG
ncbi:UDP-N-acetylmuramoyl-L-alanyl-D-glutamate--2,6-diaminopimelate ligase [bacterium DOLZORAL124_64_63]|nr:MAG: UDP-N-acetylmuramoyl-L-alanyl-D-glutamate--2,6-diaminopimelate ligase [bacterium DOLZORAL124_64_63]